MTKASTFRLLLAFALLAVTALPAHAASNKGKFTADLQSFQEVPAVMSLATGHFEAQINSSGTEISYTLTYSNLRADATQSHIHFAQPGVNGGIMVFFCSNLTSPAPPAGTPPCPLRSGTLSGKIQAGNILAVPAQGIGSGDLSGLLRALRNGMTYANVHSTLFPGGEIRGQVQPKGKKELEELGLDLDLGLGGDDSQ